MGANWNAREAYDELTNLYGETRRAYHNFVHISHVLRELDGAGNIVESLEQVEVALWYHDASYDSREKGNEEKSAELAQQRLSKAGMKSQFIDGVTTLILGGTGLLIVVSVILDTAKQFESKLVERNYDVFLQKSWKY